MTHTGTIKDKCQEGITGTLGTCYNFDCTNAKIKTIADHTNEYKNGFLYIGDAAGKLSHWADEVATCPLISCEASISCTACMSFEQNKIKINSDGDPFTETVSVTCKYQDSFTNKNLLKGPSSFKITSWGCNGNCPPNHESSNWCWKKNECKNFDGLKYVDSSLKNCENLCGMEFTTVKDKCSAISTCFNFDCSQAKTKPITLSFLRFIARKGSGISYFGNGPSAWCTSPSTCPLQLYKLTFANSAYVDRISITGRLNKNLITINNDIGTERSWKQTIKIQC